MEITLPDGTNVDSDAPEVHARLAALLGRSVSLWPLQPSSHKAHHCHAYAGARLMGQLTRSHLFRRVLRRLLPYTSWEASAQALLGREPDEPLPDFSQFPAALFEFTSLPGTYFDAFPLHFLTTASLHTMARLNPAVPWDVRLQYHLQQWHHRPAEGYCPHVSMVISVRCTSDLGAIGRPWQTCGVLGSE